MGLKPGRARLALLLLAAAALAAGVSGGLHRLGLVVPGGMAAAFHGALMVSGFLGTVISLERAIALGRREAYLAPLAAGLGALALLGGRYAAAMGLWILASLVFAGVSAAIVRRQAAAHTLLLAAAALAWFCGNVLFAAGYGAAAVFWWFAFLVLTIAAERLELTRLMQRPAWAQPLLLAIAAGLLVAAAFTITDPVAGAVYYGIALCALAAWLAAFDIARKTIRSAGFARYAAAALIGGYAWLAVGGLAWALAIPGRDVPLHAVGLGFVFSMIFAHAPVIFPAVARIRMRFTPWFYAPLALLHLSLAVRVAGRWLEVPLHALGGALNAAAILVFAATAAFAIATRAGPGTSP